MCCPQLCSSAARDPDRKLRGVCTEGTNSELCFLLPVEQSSAGWVHHVDQGSPLLGVVLAWGWVGIMLHTSP